ncbi:hypothetical protein LIER_29865 [Lithospermum erythrorhizon]|uniref:Uncharacterized protein n=1 Tax=Lithospermum erythrorhizon TaxID=34254 RepID=A0AAV3RRI4_LITER
MSEPPKLLVNKPKKSQLKQVEQPTPPPSSAPHSAPAEPVKDSFGRRYKFLWPLLIVVNISVGAYLFMRTKKKDVGPDEEVKDVSNSSGPATVVNAAVTETPVASLPIVEPPKPRQPIPEEQQRELFKWLLEEKRKIKPRDAEERKCIDEEKAILKQFIRSKSIPTL